MGDVDGDIEDQTRGWNDSDIGEQSQQATAPDSRPDVESAALKFRP